MNVCFLCGKRLPDDLANNQSEWCLAVDEESLEAHGLNDMSEVQDEAVFVHICAACGIEQGCPTAQETYEASVKMEAEEEKNAPKN